MWNPRDPLLVAVDDAPAGQVVGRQLHDDSVLGKNADVVLPHLAADMSQHLVTIRKLHTEHGVRQGLDHSAFDLDGSVFLWHVLRYLTSGSGAGSQRSFRVEGSTRDQPRLLRHRSAGGHGRVDAARQLASVRARSIDTKLRSP